MEHSEYKNNSDITMNWMSLQNWRKDKKKTGQEVANIKEAAGFSALTVLNMWHLFFCVVSSLFLWKSIQIQLKFAPT